MGCRRYMREVLRCAYCQRYRLRSSVYICPGSEGQARYLGRGPRAAEPWCTWRRYVWVGCINHNLIGSLFPLLLLPTRTKHTPDIQRAHLSHARASQHQRQPAACQDIGCKHLASPLHIGWGRGRILPLRIRATVNLASAVGPSSSHLQQFQTEKGPQTIQMPTSHD